MDPSVLLAVLVLGVLTIAGWSHLVELRRPFAIARAAAALGWRYDRYAERFLDRGLRALSLFKGDVAAAHQ